MTVPPPENLSPAWPDDTRVPVARIGDEREILTAFLDWHRATFALKCAGLAHDALSRRSIAPSGMSLAYFDALDGDPAEALATWLEECDRAGEIVAAAASLDVTGTSRVTGEPFSLRWLLVNQIAEYARHNGHADLLRERIDGAVGY